MGRGKIVEYVCTRCKASLESPFESAGQTAECPFCGKELIVPGLEKLRKLQAKQNAKEQRHRQKESARLEKEAAKQREAWQRKDALLQRRQAMEAKLARLGQKLFESDGISVYPQTIVGPAPNDFSPLSHVYAVRPRNCFLGGVAVEVIDLTQCVAEYRFEHHEAANRFIAAIRDAKGSIIVERTEVTWFISW